MDTKFDQLEVLIIKAKKKAGPLGVLAFSIKVIREVVTSDISTDDKFLWINEVCRLNQKHIKV